MQPRPILLVEDDAALREALEATLDLGGYRAIAVPDGRAALEVLARQPVGLVLSDVQMPGIDGHALLAEIRRLHPVTPVMLMTAYGQIDKAVAAMRAGACHYLPKPFEPSVLLAEVARHMLPAEMEEDSVVVGEAPASRRIFDLARRVAATSATVLITGESGVGKEVMARFIHNHSPRAKAPFVALNCAAIPESLLEATLFGHEKGAFTGAAQARPGKFEQADGGTILLDEISEMPLELQAKLLRVLQEREVERVGAAKPLKVDVRVLATSNRSLPDEVRAQRFREDLYYRLNVFPIAVPPLRERREDLPALAQHFLDRFRMASEPRRTLAADAVGLITRYPWPGNIRELENVMQRAAILAGGNEILPEHLLLPLDVMPPMEAAAPPTATPATVEVRPQPKAVVTEVLAPAACSGGGMVADLKAIERERILATLAECRGARALTAQRLGIPERTLRFRLQQFRKDGWVEPRYDE